MKHPNYKDQQSKHPIPHAKGLGKDEKSVKVNQGSPQSNKKEEEE